MDKAAIKTVLSAYRSGRRDAGDPVFTEALRAAEHDPELAAWFEEEQRFDSLMVDALKQVPTPAGLKESILLDARAAARPLAVVEATPTAWRRHAKTWLAMAASLALAFVLGRQSLPRAVPSRANGTGGDGVNRLALQAIAYTGRMPALQFVCFDADAVAQWVEQKGHAMNMGKLLEKPMAGMQMIGSSTAQWEGKPVMMIALQNGDRMAMLYLVRASDFPGTIHRDGEITEKDGWVSKTGRHGEHLYVLTTKGTRQNLDFPMPL